ncbi:hypothetical protein LOTGIDRAFT_153826 [Lottia gigantea]|uniref:Major facilitator superfamily (MFS) profile domain-containing protein n=1 Tax=Lottia gigantea TaxID=225164 RepID=V3ZJE5_LOTGI|nr:hypothetical protein LOTGIDRAFT_153826 [Lottia gigantea]ESO91388.1 hypothetical protein LOTGIDRAFT_153826 [Lottia gigantea]
MYVYLLTFFAVLGGFLLGYDTGIVSGSMLLIIPNFHLSTMWTEAVVSGTVGSAAVSALLGGFLSDCLGRKIVIIISSLLYALGAVIMGVAGTQSVLLLGRIVVGIGIGFGSTTIPVYIAESAPSDIRGQLVTLNQLFITIGILVSSLVVGGFSSMKTNGWRYMLGLGSVPAVFQFLGMLYLPESPRWLLDHELQATARYCLMKIRGTDEIDNEINNIKASIEAEKKISKEDDLSTLVRIWKTPHVRKAVFVGCTLQIFQQVCGINTIIYYSASILKMGGVPVKAAIWLVAAPNGVNFLATFIGIVLVDKAGRKILLLLSFIGIFVSLIFMATGFQLASIYSPPLAIYENISSSCNTNEYHSCNDCTRNLDCGYCYSSDLDGSCLPVDPEKETQSSMGRCNSSESVYAVYTFAHDYCPNDYAWMLIFGMCLFVFSFAPGLGPMPWTINSEIYPLWARSTAMSISTATNWIFNLLIAFTFLSLTQAITKYGVFWLFGAMSILGFIFTLLFVPETKNRTLEELDTLFINKKNNGSNGSKSDSDNDGVVIQKVE